MMNLLDRRTFLQTAGAAVAAAAWAGQGRSVLAADVAPLSTPTAARLGWQVAIEMYTFRSISLYEALEKIAAMGVQHVEPGFFLKLDSKRPELQTNENLSPELRKEMKQRMADYGVTMSNFYGNVGTDADAAKKIFEFVKEMGGQTVVSEPPPEAFDMVEKLCDEYQLNFGIHNHPKAPNYTYWNPENVMAVCEGRSKRIGACVDTGHWIRSGLQVMPCLKVMEGRIVTFHLKDVAEFGKPEARDVPLGEGLADYKGVLKELKRQGFRGVMPIEYEHESDQLVEDVRKCVTFVEQTAKQLAG